MVSVKEPSLIASVTDRIGRDNLKLVSGGMVAKFAYAPLTLAVTILLTRLLTVAEFGVYSFVTTAILLAVMPAQIGLPAVLLRFVTQYRTKGQADRLLAVYNWGRRLVVLMIGIGLGGLVVWYALDPNLSVGLIPALIVVPLMADSALRSGVLRGLGRPILGLVPEQTLRPSVHLLALGGIAFWGWRWDGGFGVSEALWVYTASFLVAWVVGAFWLRREVGQYREQATQDIDTTDRRAWLGSLTPMMAMGGVNTLNYHMDIILLQQLVGEEQVGLYKVALSAVVFVSFGLVAINSVMAPKYGEAFHRGDIPELTHLARVTVGAAMATAVPILILFLIAPGTLLALLFGEAYRGAGVLLVILCVGHVFNVIGGPCGLVLRMSGYERVASKAVVTTAIFNIAANVVLIPRYGAVGGAVATSISFAVMNVWMYLQVRNHIGAKYLG